MGWGHTSSCLLPIRLDGGESGSSLFLLDLGILGLEVRTSDWESSIRQSQMEGESCFECYVNLAKMVTLSASFLSEQTF